MNVQNPDDTPFRHYTLKHRIVAWISQNLFDHLTYTVRHGLIKGMKRKGGLAWLPESLAGSTHTPEQSFWMNQDFRDLVVYDIGAFQGLLTLFFARRARTTADTPRADARPASSSRTPVVLAVSRISPPRAVPTSRPVS